MEKNWRKGIESDVDICRESEIECVRKKEKSMR